MKNSEPITKVSLLLGTIICLGAFFLVDYNIPVQALHKEQQILEDYDDLAEFANAVRNGDEDLEEIPIQSMEAADIYDDADDSLKDCIDLAAKVGDSLSDREVIHCVDDINYFKNKYSSNSSVPTNGTFDTSAIPTVTDTDTETDATSTSETSTSDDATSTSETSTSDDATSTSETSTSDDVTENNLINELVNTGKFTEDEAKEFVSQNMLSGTNATTTSDDTQTTSDAETSTDDTQTTSDAETSTNDTQTTSDAETSTDDTQTTSDAETSTDDTQTTSDAETSTNDTSSSGNESSDDDSSSNNTNNPEEYDSLSELVDDIKNGVVDTDEISLSNFQNSGAYQGADQETQDCIDLAGKIGDNLIDYEIVRCTEDANHFKNQIANNDDNTDGNNDSNNNEPNDDTGN